MPIEVATYLERLEGLVDPNRAQANAALQEQAWAYAPVPHIPRVINFRDKVSKERKGYPDWPMFPYGEVFGSRERMLLDELEDTYVGALVEDDKVYTIRANYGVGILPSVFGCRVHSGSGEDLPWVEHIESPQELRRIVSCGLPDLGTGLLARALETSAYFMEALAPYPNLSRAVHVSQADLQGPMNVASEIVGSAIYTLIYDDPVFVHELLDLVTEALIAATAMQKELLGEERDKAYHWHFRTLGGVRISEDFALSMSPRHYEEFSAPYNARVYAAFGGGYLLYADAGLPVLKPVLNTPGITGLYRWTERAEEFEVIWPLVSQRRICLIWNGPLPNGWQDKASTGLILEQVVSDASVVNPNVGSQ